MNPVFEIELSQDVFDVCNKFATDSVNTSWEHYKKRGHTSKEKCIKDILTGKMAEFAAAAYFRSINVEVFKSPDTETYGQSEKTFDTDLTVGLNGRQTKVAIKSQSKEMSDRLGEMSWTFQFRDRDGNKMGHYDKEIFDFPESIDPVVFCSVDGRKIQVMASVSIKFLHANQMFKIPAAVTKYGRSKKCVYLDLLTEALENNGNIPLSRG